MTNAVIRSDYVMFKPVPSRKVLQIICEIPLEKTGEFLDMFGTPNMETGTPVAIARLMEPGRGSLPSSAPSDGSDSGTAMASDNAPSGEGKGPNSLRPSQDGYRHTLKNGFMQWLNVSSREAAEEVIERQCGVLSLSELDKQPSAADRWSHMKAEFEEKWRPIRAT
jgi:hypothetical protein